MEYAITFVILGAPDTIQTGIKFSGNDDVARYSILGNSDKI